MVGIGYVLIDSSKKERSPNL